MNITEYVNNSVRVANVVGFTPWPFVEGSVGMDHTVKYFDGESLYEPNSWFLTEEDCRLATLTDGTVVVLAEDVTVEALNAALAEMAAEEVG